MENKHQHLVNDVYNYLPKEKEAIETDSKTISKTKVIKNIVISLCSRMISRFLLFLIYSLFFILSGNKRCSFWSWKRDSNTRPMVVVKDKFYFGKIQS